MPSYRFTDETPPAQLLTDINNLNNFSEQQFTQFIELLTQFLAHNPAAEASLAAFAGEHGINLKPLKNTVTGILYFLSIALRKNMSPVHVAADLQALGLSEEKATVFSERWASNFVALSETQIAKTLSVNELSDIQWRFGGKQPQAHSSLNPHRLMSVIAILVQFALQSSSTHSSKLLRCNCQTCKAEFRSYQLSAIHLCSAHMWLH